MFFDKDFVGQETDYRRGQLKASYARANRPISELTNAVVMRSAIIIAVIAIILLGLGQAGDAPVSQLEAPADVVYRIGSGGFGLK